MEKTREFLRSIGLPGGDAYDLPTSDKRFPDGAQYRFEVPGIQGPKVMAALLAEMDRYGINLHRVTQTKGIMMLTDNEIIEMVRLAGEAQTDDEDGKELPSTVTLLVTPEQSKVLAELEEEGTIHLTLVYRGSKENAEKFLTAQDDVLLELYPPEPDPEEASQEETTQEETPTGTDNPEETEVETPTESEEVV